MQLANYLLSALDADDLAAFTPSLADTDLAMAQVLFEVGDRVETIYFPSNACISVVSVMADGTAVETTTTGRESAVALIDAITDMPARSRIFCQVAGGGARMPAAKYRARMAESSALQRLTMMHVRATAGQAEQGAACNATHAAEPRLARWLLMTQDRVGADTFPLTQEYMAVMTGVQRSTVSLCAGALKAAGTIAYSRGMLRVLDREALKARACECYQVVQTAFEEVQPTRAVRWGV